MTSRTSVVALRAVVAVSCLGAVQTAWGSAGHEVSTWVDPVRGLEISASPLIVTSSNGPAGGDKLTTPGVPAYGVNVDGVGRMFVDNNPAIGFGGLCSSSLLWTGQHILTAAHCVTDSSGNINVIDGVDGNVVTFTTPTGVYNAPFTSSMVTKHPSYNGNVFAGYDVAIITLPSTLDPSVTRYSLNTSTTADLNSTGIAVGFGQSGHGSTGTTIAAGTKRAGLNKFEDDGLPLPGITNNSTQLTADFDSGSSANDAFPFFGLGSADLGFGTDEVGTAPGDSGGPTFILDGGTPLIAGVHSYGLRLAFNTPGNPSSDVDGSLNASWGEFWVDARIADAAVLGWIQSVVPEPSSTVTLLAGIVMFAIRRRRN